MASDPPRISRHYGRDFAVACREHPFRTALIAVAVSGFAFLMMGAVAGATSRDKIQGDVQVRIVNDLSAPVQIAICTSRNCSSTDPMENLEPGGHLDQAMGPRDTEFFAVDLSPDAPRSSPVDGRAYRCTQISSGDVVAEEYDLSAFVPCSR